MLWWVISQAYDYIETVLFIVYIIYAAIRYKLL